jgi:electron transfer flavoprotein alpha subunit
MTEENRAVWAFSEVPQLTLELLGKGRILANDLGTELAAVLVGANHDAERYIRHGADKVFSIEDPLLNAFQVDTYTDAFSELINQHKPDVLLIGATRSGLEFAPRLAERLKTGCVTEATRLELDAEKRYVLMDRVVWGGNVVETHLSRAKPQIATVPKGLFLALPSDSTRKGEVIEFQPGIKPSSTNLLETKPKSTKREKLTDAQVIVAFGRGVRKKEDMATIVSFAQTAGGVIGCSRPIAEDLDWLPEDQYIGLSGQKVGPRLYFACGISGQIQHVTGIRNSRIIVAINNDPKAPIFEFSDYGLVADLYDAIPALTKAIKQLNKN